MKGPFTVHKYDEGDGAVRIAVHGEIDNDSDEALSLIIVNAAVQSGITALIIDLDGVTFLAAAGIRSLLDGHLAALRHHCSYHVVNARGSVADALTAAGVAGDLSPALGFPAHPASCQAQAVPR
ncbi:STAS domain-containing protein [Actinoplanes sp. NPDC024001]|uniref:STAS domain-containing protein n=1 Tax=Actinoplanes sp. NPDC024001 TaxID=3154598 RepID=UPI0033E8C19D